MKRRAQPRKGKLQTSCSSQRMTRMMLFIFTLSSLFLPLHYAEANEGNNITAIFVFGDSIFDSGNNIYLANSTATANFLPYGIDFVAPTGRFTNERTIADILGQFLGFPHFLPCFNDPSTYGIKILSGVNYASAGSGILDSTNTNTRVIPLNEQIMNFEEGTLPELSSLLGSNLSAHLSQSIFVFNAGGNDYIAQCLDETKCYLPQFTELLIGNFTEQLKWLYGLGARKFVLFSLQVSGCTPGSRAENGGNCSEVDNQAALLFNTHLNASIDNLMEEMAGCHFVFANSYKVLSEIIKDPISYGFKVVDKACCAVTSDSYWVICEKNGSVCEDRNAYLYFDGGHPTSAANLIIATRMYLSEIKSDVYPFNVKHLAGLALASIDTYRHYET